MNKFVIVALCAMVAIAAAQVPVYSSPKNGNGKAGASSYGASANGGAKNAGAAAEEPKPYSFDWSVKDEESKNDYGHKETSDGKVVTGSYRVALPDGRVQVVTYRADENGYVADVKYEGEAQYPEPSQNGKSNGNGKNGNGKSAGRY